MKTTAIAVALMLATGNVPAQPTEAPFLEASSTFQQAREAWMPWSKMKYSEQGLDHIDRALDALKPGHERVLVRGVPVGLETRFVAASMFIALPDGIFHRRAAGLKLLDEVQRHPSLAAAPEPFRNAVKRTAAQAAGGGK